MTGTQSYTASVANSVTSTTVTAETTDANATSVVKLDGAVDTDGTVDLAVGNNTITVEVTAENTSTMLTYTVEVTRNVPPNLVVNPTSLTIGEAGSDTFTVKLATEPSSNVTVTVSSDDTGAATVSPASLTFTTSNWNTNQTVTVSGVNDTDTADESLTVSLSATGGGYGGKTSTVSVSVTDDDDGVIPNVSLSETALSVTEGDAAGDSYTVVLDSMPTADVVVTVGGHSGTDVTPTPTILTFTTSNWDTDQTVTVTAGDDADTENDTVTLTHSAASTDSNYSGITIDDVTVTVTVNDNDIDTTAGICGRTEEVRDALVALIPGVSDCAAVTADDLTAITGPLDLSSQNITALAAGDFAGLTRLENLYLDSNGLNPLPAGVFAGLTSLDLLFLDNNGLTTLPVDVFAGLTQLRTLFLNNNQLNTLPVGVFDGLTQLQILYLNNNQLNTLPDDVFAGLTSLIELYLKNNGLNTLPVGVFAGLTALTQLELNDNGLTTLPVGVFAGLTQLQILYLNNNQLNTLPDDVFAGLTSLSFLWLYNNDLTTLPGDVFDELTALETLRLEGNQLTSLPVEVFAGLTQLRTLFLNNNQLTTLPVGVFDGLTQLRTLYLNNNQLNTLPDDVFAGLTSLSFLWLYNNDLTTLPGDVFDELTALETLRLEDNDLATLPEGVFELLTALTDLRLSGNSVAPVAPTADALPDDGTVSTFGGTVTLDGSGSNGGPWGTNVTYAWALTTPASGATFDNDTSATPEVTIQTLGGGTKLTFTLTVTGRGHKDTTFGTGTDTDTATVTATTITTTTPGITVSPTTLPVNEGSTGTYTVLLDTQPTATVTVTINDPTDNTDVTADPASLSFSTSNWSTLQTVTVRAAEDADSAQDTGTVTHTVSGGDYGSVTAADVAVTVTDNDTAGVTVSPTTLTVNEGSTRTYTVALNTQPSGSVTVAITSNNTDVTVSSSSLTFTTGNWNTAQTITVTAAQDTDAANDTAVLTHDPSGADYNSVSDVDLTVTVTDDDTANAAPTFDDGGSTTRTFDETIGDTTVGTASNIGTPVSATDPDTGDTLEYSLEGTDRAKFTFDTSSGQIKTRAGESYDYEADSSYSVMVTVNDGTVTVSSAVTINVTDRNEPPPVMNKPVVTATANSTTSLEVSWTAPSNLGRPRIDSYDLQYRVGNTGDFSNGPQNQTGSSAAIGNLTADTSYEVQVRATNAEGDGVWSPSGTGNTGTTTITDPAGVTVSPTALTVTEEDMTGASYTVVLDTHPTASVTVTVAGHAGTEVTPSPTSLTFTRSNWDMGQTVTVTAGDDADTVTDTVTLTHGAMSADSNYNGITIASVTVTVIDNDDFDTTAGICGRTEEVRDALVAQIPGVSDCAAVTDADLAAITGPLALSGESISVLAAGDFDGLTALEVLYLNNNGLETLPKDVFAGLTRLKVLTLYYNELTTLPDGVFGPLTALNFLYLGDNPRAPFAPTAVARPDAGTVSTSGGTVRLDGSGSGGPWGTNVTYRWALTTPASGVRVTFDDSTSATPEVTIPNLAARTELAFTLTVTGRGGTDGIETATATARVTATQNITNNPPVFAGGAVQARTLAETIGDATVTSASDIGTPVSATEPDTGDTLEYRLEGTDRTKFGINATSGQIRTKVGESYDYEARTSYSVRVAVTDGTVTVSSAVTINVTDQDEPPLVMNKPVVTATADSTTSLEVSWTAPSNTGRPRIDSYDLQYRVGNTGDFSNGPQNQTGSSAAIGNLTADTSYEVQVRATNAEGDGVWSPSGTGNTGTTTITDPAGVTVSPTALTVTEEDMTGASYTVVLDTHPTASVTVTVAGHAGTEVTPSPTSLTFTRSNWDMGQTVTVTAGDDADTVTDTVTLTHGAMSADSNYNGITIASVTVTVIDNDDFDTTAGICGRTEEVRDALVAQIPGVSDCAAVTDADLAAITGPLALSGESISVLAAGDFDGLTALKTLNLDHNDLTELPDGVFAGLTELEALYLNDNELETLPDDVFAGLTSLKFLYLGNNKLTSLPDGLFDGLTSLDLLYLNNNGLTSLPDGLFEPLTSLKALRLAGNQGASFAPTAVARPDAGTFSTSGGTVRLDGGGSGGPWGTNVTYRWALTTPARGVMFDDARSPTPEVTIPVLAAGTELTFTLTVTGRGHIGSGTDTASDTAMVTATDSVIASGDATLSGLRVNDGTGDLTLDPAFASATTAYTAEVGNAVTTVTLTATVNQAGASVSAVTLDGTAIADSNFTDGIRVPSLRVGDNGIVVTVTAENGATETYTVTVARTAAVGNTAPTASDSSVTTTEDTAYPFAAGEFNFADSDAGDALASVRVVTLPVAGALGLDGTAVTAGQAVGAEDIGKLVFTPAANGNGTGYASFTFRVSDGTDESASAYTMEVNVTAVNDPATGAPTISGTAQVGEALTAATKNIVDADGLASPTYGYQWVRVDADGTSNPTDITGETSSTYSLAAEDVGKKLQVKVSFTDDDSNDEELTSGAYPASGTVEAAPTAAGVTVSETALTVTEEDMTGGSYTVVLDTHPTASVTVTVAGHAGTDVTPNRDTLTFTTSNWDTAQAVTVTAGDDADTVNDTVTLTHSAASTDSNYQGITIGNVKVTVNDDDIDTTAGICGRTEEVRDALVALIPGVSDGAAVTAADLAAITGPLNLSDQSIAGLAAGDFAGLTRLENLYLHNNGLTSLPGGVFDGLTRLEVLFLSNNGLTSLSSGDFDGLTSVEVLTLDNNELTELPAGVFAGPTMLTLLTLHNNELEELPGGVFDELTRLKTLYLFNNDLATLPEDVFEPLTSLKVLYLAGNPGAPFAPKKADARPDDGTVPVDGGTVRLDGSGSDGGPWGTNVSYSWELTTPVSGMTFTDDTSATPEVTIPELEAGTELTFTLTVIGRGGTNSGIETATDTAKVTATDSVIASGDATLSGLTVNDGTRELTLAPAFASGTTDYTASVGNSVTMVTLMATVNHAGASVSAVTLNGTAITDNDITDGIRVPTLLVGGNGIVVTVRAENGATQTYTVTMSRTATTTDTPGVSVSPAALTVTEEETTGETYTVVLDSQPTASVEITVAGHSGTDVTPNRDTLTFTTSNWDTAQAVTVTAGDDTDTTTDTVTLSHSAASADSDYDGIMIANVEVTVNDDDTPAVSICGRTPEVRDALLDLISGVSDGAAVTAADLAAITGPLNLSDQNIAGLAAGDFAGLTRLENLYLHNNGLTSLPGGVFDGLTRLEVLFLSNNGLTSLSSGDFDGLTSVEVLTLDNNELTELPAGVFAGPTMLTLLTLHNNELDELPGGVFDELTRLSALKLGGNPGAPFAPTADARPDDGTVPVDGGTVRLDGSGSDGGPWGTNVSYSWELTTPVSGVTFDDDTSATPEVTIPELEAGTELTFTLTVIGRGGTNSGIETATDTAKVTATDSVIASGDATLSGLTVNDGTRELTLAPAFASGTTDYTASVGNSVTMVTLMATVNHAGASVSAVTLNGTAITDNDITDGVAVSSRLAGDHEIVVTVTEENGATQTYTVARAARPNSAATGAPTIGGTAQLGSR